MATGRKYVQREGRSSPVRR